MGNDCLKSLHQMMSLDDIEQIMDDTKDAIEYQNVINFWTFILFEKLPNRVEGHDRKLTSSYRDSLPMKRLRMS